MAQNTILLGDLIDRKNIQGRIYVDNYIILIGVDNDYCINLNGYEHLTLQHIVAYNNVNGVWFLKIVGRHEFMSSSPMRFEFDSDFLSSLNIKL